MPIFKPSTRKESIQYLDELYKKKHWVKIERIPEKKSVNQNNYIWLVFTVIAYDTGNEPKDIYEYYLDKFPVYKTIYKNKAEIIIRISMSRFNKDQMRKFIDKVIIDARQEGYNIPNPEDKKALDMYNYYRKKGLI